MNKIIYFIAKKYGLKEAEVEGLGFLIQKKPKIELRELVKLTGLPHSTVKNLVKEFSKQSFDNLKSFNFSLIEYKNKKIESEILNIKKSTFLTQKGNMISFLLQNKQLTLNLGY